MHDLAIVIVSTNEGHWLRPCLSSIFEHAGAIELDVVVADNESTDETRAIVESFAGARVVSCRNRGFAHANNRGYITADARYVLFLNPDTEVLEGTFADVVNALDDRPEVGLVGVRQLGSDGSVFPTIRRFPNALRALGDALATERWPVAAGSIGERVLDPDAYEREGPCDWTSGSFMLARREALESAGLMDERFFIYSEEPDLCYRIKAAGWDVRHVPWLTIVHHANKAGVSPKLEAQDAYARMQHARKHFSWPHRAAYAGALALNHALRAAAAPGDSDVRGLRREASLRALRATLGLESPPFGPPPEQAFALRSDASTPAADTGGAGR
jgi:GT2 family glycosyltransferase